MLCLLSRLAGLVSGGWQAVLAGHKNEPTVSVGDPSSAKIPVLRVACQRCLVPSRAVNTDWIVTRYISCR